MRVEIDNESVPSALYKEERGALTFSFDLNGGEKVVVSSYTAAGIPLRFDCYEARATSADKPMLYESVTGRLYTDEERAVLARLPPPA